MPIPTILVVENRPVTLERLCATFESPPIEWQRETGITAFKVQQARHAEEVLAKLAAARDAGQRFDVLWFDLGLPVDALELQAYPASDDPGVGIKLLREIREADVAQPERRIVGNIVVGSAYGGDIEILRDLIRTRIVQYFVPKPWDSENRTPFMTVVEALRNDQGRRWNEYKQARLIRWQTQAALVRLNRIGQIVTQGVGSANSELRRLKEKLEEVYHLSATLDRANPICRLCDDVQRSLTKIATEYRAEQESLEIADESAAGELPDRLSDLIELALENTSCGLNSKVLTLHRKLIGESDIAISESQYVLMILEEMLYGAIESSTPGCSVSIDVQPLEWTVNIAIRDEGKQQVDEGKQLVDDESKMIRKAPTIKPVGGRVWGLALAQYVALNIGAHLEVARSGSGNIVTLTLPRMPRS